MDFYKHFLWFLVDFVRISCGDLLQIFKIDQKHSLKSEISMQLKVVVKKLVKVLGYYYFY